MIKERKDEDKNEYSISQNTMEPFTTYCIECWQSQIRIKIN